MTFRLRSRRETCLRSPRGALLAVAGVVALAAAPAAAAQQPQFLKPLGWYPEELHSQVPATVAFADVAASGGMVVAVGADTATGAPAIFSRTGSGWQPAPVATPLPAPGTLEDVALGNDGAVGWAVGTAGEQKLVLELVNGVWTDRSAVAALPAAPTAVALNGSGAIVGDSAGNLRRVAPGGGASEPQEAASAAAINGIALFSGNPGIAVADYKRGDALSDRGARIYELRDRPLLEANEQTRTPPIDMTGLAAAAPNHAVALDSTNSTWRLTLAFGQNDWIQGNPVPDASQLAAVASVLGGPAPWDGAGWATEFLAGREGTAGAIWQRTRWTKDPAGWKRDPLPSGTPELKGIAATAWNAAWAVGAGGTILRYWRPPDPDAEAAWLAAQQQEEQQQSQEDGSWSDGGGTGQTETTVVTLRDWQPSGSSSLEPGEERLVTNGVVVDDGDTSSPTRKRLVTNVRAIFRREASGRRKLIVKFRLTRRARVRVSAKRGRRVIAESRARTLRRGRRKVVMPVRGKKPPTSLKLIARPARRAT